MLAMRVASASAKTTFLLPNQMANIVRKARTKSMVIIVAEPVQSELLVLPERVKWSTRDIRRASSALLEYLR